MFVGRQDDLATEHNARRVMKEIGSQVFNLTLLDNFDHHSFSFSNTNYFDDVIIMIKEKN